MMDHAEKTALESEDADENRPLNEKRPSFTISAANLLAISHFFSAWGDRMWMFAVGLYLVELTPNSLRLTAIYGLAVSFSVVLFASTVGHWVDVNARLTVVRVSLLVQNLLVCGSALVILAILYRKPGHPVVLKVCEASVIILGSMANLASQASTIAIEKDWIVVVSGEDKNALADINAKMRRIDLTCAILAPVVVGFIMSLGSNIAGIIFICAWNVLSFFAEYHLLRRVYRAVPRLAVKNFKPLRDEHRRGSVESIYDDDELSKIIHEEETVVEKRQCGWCFQSSCDRLKSFYNGWRIFFNQSVALAGTSLALIYLTVLGFSSVTTGYAYTQRLSGAVLSVCFAVGSLMGIIGTFLYPRIRKKVGLMRTGLISFFLQWSMLIFCVVSIWTPGSPSDLYPRHIHLWQKQKSNPMSNIAANSTSTALISTFVSTSKPLLYSKQEENHKQPRLLNTIALQGPNVTANANHTTPITIQEKFSYISISLLMVGLLLSRIGLWMTDLTITQLLQENVEEQQRGIVGGTQSAFNAVLDMLHYVLTIILPSPNQFGILTLISFAAISLGYLSYIVFYIRKAGELGLRENVRERDIGSVSAVEWQRDHLLHDDAESKGFTILEEDEEEIVRGTLYLREHVDDDKVYA